MRAALLLLGHVNYTPVAGTPMTEQYFVASDGEEPIRIYFDRDEAFSSRAAYLDSFDAQGMPVQHYMRDSDGRYVTDF